MNDMVKASCHLRCLVVVRASSSEQLGHLWVRVSGRHDQGCVPSALLCSVGASPSAQPEGWTPASGRHDQGRAICTALSSSAPAHESVWPPLGGCVDRYDQGCVPSALPCSCRCSTTARPGSQVTRFRPFAPVWLLQGLRLCRAAGSCQYRASLAVQAHR